MEKSKNKQNSPNEEIDELKKLISELDGERCEIQKITERHSVPYSLVNKLNLWNGEANPRSYYCDVHEYFSRAIEDLTETKQRIIMLHHYNELCISDIAKVVKLTEAETTKAHDEALEKIKVAVEKFKEKK